MRAVDDEIIYFSSVSENTHRFVKKLNLPASRLPLKVSSETCLAQRPYVLIVPTYGGGSGPGAVPKQVIKFLNVEHNRSLLRGVIVAGNSNFGKAYGLAGEIIAYKCQVPLLYRFELLGTADDVIEVKQRLEHLWTLHRHTA